MFVNLIALGGLALLIQMSALWASASAPGESGSSRSPGSHSAEFTRVFQQPVWCMVGCHTRYTVSFATHTQTWDKIEHLSTWNSSINGEIMWRLGRRLGGQTKIILVSLPQAILYSDKEQLHISPLLHSNNVKENGVLLFPNYHILGTFFYRRIRGINHRCILYTSLVLQGIKIKNSLEIWNGSGEEGNCWSSMSFLGLQKVDLCKLWRLTEYI
jgi:hypothetical protein